MHGYGYLQPDSAAHHARNRHQIISHDVLGDARRPGARADLQVLMMPSGQDRDVKV